MTAEARVSLTPAGAGSEIPVQSLSLDRVLSHPVGRAELVLPAGVEPPETGASLSLSAEVSGSEVTLMTGEVARMTRSDSGTRIIVVGEITPSAAPEANVPNPVPSEPNRYSRELE